MDIKAPIIKYMQSVACSVDVDAIRKVLRLLKVVELIMNLEQQ